MQGTRLAGGVRCRTLAGLLPPRAHAHTHKNAHAHTSTRTQARTRKHTRAHTHTHKNAHAHTHTRTHKHMNQSTDRHVYGMRLCPIFLPSSSLVLCPSLSHTKTHVRPEPAHRVVVVLVVVVCVCVCVCVCVGGGGGAEGLSTVPIISGAVLGATRPCPSPSPRGTWCVPPFAASNDRIRLNTRGPRTAQRHTVSSVCMIAS